MEPLGDSGYLIVDIDNLDEIQKQDQFLVKITLQGVLMKKNAILDGCSTVDSKLDYDGI